MVVNFNFASSSFQYKRQILTTLIISIGFFGAGCVVGWSSTALPSLTESEGFQNIGLIQKSWIASLVHVGALISAPIAGFSLDYFGRKSTIMVAAAVQILGWLFILSSTSVSTLYIGRIISGLSVGTMGMSIPVYISDIAESSIRGALCSLGLIMSTIGISCSFVLGSFVSWKYLSVLSAIPPVLLLALSGFVPESQRYYLCIGKIDDAVRVTRWLRADKPDADADEEIIPIIMNLEEIQEEDISPQDTLCSAHIIKPLLSSCVLMIIQQLSGYNALLFYSVYIFESAGVKNNAYLCTMVVGFLLILITVIEALLIDVTGRRILLMVSGVLMTIAQFTLGIFYEINGVDSDVSSFWSWILVTMLLLYFAAFAIGYGPIPWILMSEILPNHVIGLASTLAVFLHYATAFLVVFSFQECVNYFGIAAVLIFFGSISFLGTVFVYYAIPETKLKTLEEIQMYYGHKSTINTFEKAGSSDSHKSSNAFSFY